MASRVDLQRELEELFDTKNVYFQPPESVKLRYDCVVYSVRSGDTRFADNKPYSFRKSYDVTLIRKSPESDWTDKMAMHFPMCKFDRSFKADNLNHDVFILYY